MVHLINRGKIQASNSRFQFRITIANIPSLVDILDQPRVNPPNGNYRNRNWHLWTLDSVRQSYGFSLSLALSLARPNLGLVNAESYAVFAMCLTYQNLDCVVDVADAIARRESLPFQPAPEAVEQIRQGRSTLLREDDEMLIGRDLGNDFE